MASVRLEDLVNDVTSESELLQSLDKNIESLDAEIRARDLLLTSELTIEAANLKDNRDAVTFARRTRSRFLDIIYDQAFSTGTLMSLTAGHDRGTFDNFGNRNTGDWEVRLTQSLWRDAFGQFTSYRRQGDRAELQNRKAGLIYQKQLVLIDLEALYWDLAFAVKEEEIRLKNIDASKNLKNWTAGRVERSAAEKSDVLQAKALLSGRELDLITTRNQIQSVRNRFRQLFVNADKANLVPDISALEKERPVMTLVAEQGTLEEPKRLDAIVSEKLVVQAEMEAKKVRERLKPQLDAYVSYGQNGIATTFDDAWTRAGDSNHSATRVGVLFKIPLNRKLTNERERSLQLTAEANKLKAQYMNRNSKVGWAELVRQVNTLKEQVAEATRLADFQIQKVQEERRRFRLGRSTVFQLVTFEADAAEAEVRKYRFLADLRKAESQARLFTMQEVGS
ncbi:MAG: TolC family protein [Bdellovibrionaceae bacterium]|nr:TolC family protein [Pseudobdellovibrionaceae bacterium]